MKERKRSHPWPRSRETALRRSLLRWYDEQARSLPWRRSKNPYRIWVAEVMLQQTRIEVVVPAYRRFLKRFPTLTSLARATEDDVLSLWSGLGYYLRARALHRAARELRGRGQRTFPREEKAARALPGVGPYTAAAVLSIAYGVPLAAVDGNVVRVLSRLRRLEPPNAAGEPHQSIARALLHPARPGDWNQAVMELGQTVCTPRSPRCDVCPVARFCDARRCDEVSLYPKPSPRRPAEHVELHLFLVRDRTGRLLLERGAFPYLPHLWLPLCGAESAKLKAQSSEGDERGPVSARTRHRQGSSGANIQLKSWPSSSPPRKRGSIEVRKDWIPAFAGMTDAVASGPFQRTFERSALRFAPFVRRSAAPRATRMRELGSFSHAIVHRVFDVRLSAVEVHSRREVGRGTDHVERRWFAEAELAGIGRSALLTKAIALLPRASLRRPTGSRPVTREDARGRSTRSRRPRSAR